MDEMGRNMFSSSVPATPSPEAEMLECLWEQRVLVLNVTIFLSSLLLQVALQ